MGCPYQKEKEKKKKEKKKKGKVYITCLIVCLGFIFVSIVMTFIDSPYIKPAPL